MKMSPRLFYTAAFLMLAMVVAILISSCSGAGPHAVKDAIKRDTIDSVETKENGSHFIWMTHDDVGVYCTMNNDLYQKALTVVNDKKHDPYVIMHYISSNLGSEENKNFFQDPLGVQGCKHDAATVYVITSLEAVSDQ